ncbi:MAG: hypothetical protein ACREJB_18445 [Planctomycetaceae bacterium]
MGQLDVSLKHALSAFPSHWAEFVGVRHGTPIEVVDTDVSTVTGIADKAFLVREDEPFLLHLELQGYYDKWLDDRMHVYNVLMRRRHRVFVHSVAIILDRHAWGPANTNRITAESPLGGCRVEFAYEVIKAWELPVERVLAGGVGILPLAPIADVPQRDVPDIIGRLTERFEHELPRAEASEFWTATYVLLGLKYDQAFAQALLQGIHDIMKESSTYQAIIEEGMERGAAKAKRDTLILLGTRRFDAPDAGTLAAINAIADLDRLDAMLLRVLDADGWSDILAVNHDL